jgi:hypothetical protein
MADLIDRPPAGIVLDEDLLKGYDSFPGRVFLISVGGDKYACNNATLPDGQKINGLACFPSGDDATTYMGLLSGLSGDIIGKSFEEAREIAISKPVLSALFLFQAGKIVDVHYVR